jgi:hypothetical protein
MRQIVNMQFGSHVYGTNLPTSDQDFKGIFIPSSYDLIMQQAAQHIQKNTKLDKNSKNSADDVDEELFSVQRYLKLLAEGQTVALDMLFAPEKFYRPLSDGDHSHYIWRLIQSNKGKLIHSGTSSFVGYCKTQAAKYGLKGGRVSALRYILDILTIADYSKLSDFEDKVRKHVTEYEAPSDGNEPLITIVNIRAPNGMAEPHLCVANRKVPFSASFKYAREIYQKILDKYGERALLAEKNENIDHKALMHAVRVAGEAKELLLTGNITFPRPNADLLLKIRKGELPYKEVEALIENGLVEVEAAKEKSLLPKQACQDMIDEIVYEAHVMSIEDRYGGLE